MAKKQIIHLERLRDVEVVVPIVGITPVIPHKWSEKARKQMLAKQMGKATKKKPPKDPQADAEASLYRISARKLGMPAVAFKGAIVDACRFFDGLTMTTVKRSVFVRGEGQEQLVEIKGEKHFREDPARNESGVIDLRHRYSIWPWSANLVVVYMAEVLTQESVISLVDAAGRSGVGDWRPGSPKSNTGTYGQFRVEGA